MGLGKVGSRQTAVGSGQKPVGNDGDSIGEPDNANSLLHFAYCTLPTAYLPLPTAYSFNINNLRDNYLTSFLYLILCGVSSPNLFFLFSSHSLKLPSNQNTCESPSNARMCVQTRSRNQRSWEIITAQPPKFSNASSSARRVLMSRSLVGSSNKRRLPPCFTAMATWVRLRIPPESSLTFFCWSVPLKLNLLT